MRKSRIVVFGLVLTVVLAAGLVAFFYFGGESPPISLTLTPPGHTYTVRINERVDPYLTPIRIDSRKFPIRVLFTAKKGDRILATNELFWDYESSNERFSEDAYHEWVSESVLKFGVNHSVSKPIADEVTVSNDSDETIDYLVIHSGESFLILDLAPKATVRFPAYHRTWSSFVECSGGAFASGKKVGFNGRDFPLHDTEENPVPQRFTINIGPEGTYINTSNPLVQ